MFIFIVGPAKEVYQNTSTPILRSIVVKEHSHEKLTLVFGCTLSIKYKHLYKYTGVWKVAENDCSSWTGSIVYSKTTYFNRILL